MKISLCPHSKLFGPYFFLNQHQHFFYLIFIDSIVGVSVRGLSKGFWMKLELSFWMLEIQYTSMYIFRYQFYFSLLVCHQNSYLGVQWMGIFNDISSTILLLLLYNVLMFTYLTDSHIIFENIREKLFITKIMIWILYLDHWSHYKTITITTYIKNRWPRPTIRVNCSQQAKFSKILAQNYKSA